MEKNIEKAFQLVGIQQIQLGLTNLLTTTLTPIEIEKVDQINKAIKELTNLLL